MDAWAKTLWKFSEPNVVKIRNIPIRKPKSPIRFTMNAFFAASPVVPFSNFLSYQNPISRYEQSPTPSQPEEHQQEIVGHDEVQHREDEEVEVGEEAPEPRIAVHVADRVDVDQEADAR